MNQNKKQSEPAAAPAPGPAAVYSMTGFARVRHSTPAGDATFILKSVNHRALDIHVHLPEAIESFEPRLRAVLKSTVRRGHVDLRVLWEPAAGQSTIRFNAGLLDAYMAAFRQAAASYGLNGGPDLNSALRIPGMLQAAPVNEMAPRLEEDLAAGLELALAAWNAFREREGEQLRREMLAHHENLAALGARMTGLREELVSALRARLDQRLGELQARVDPSRLAQEAALLVERSDVAEEIARFNTHAGQLGELLAGGGEIGKKLDFLLQEIGRETNTFLAKSANAGAAAMILSDLALTAKSAVEKIREQSLNVE